MTLVISLGVLAGAVMTGGLQGALVNVELAGPALVARGGAVTLETIDKVSAGSTILTGPLCALVNLHLTIVSSVAWQTPTLSALNTNIRRISSNNITAVSTPYLDKYSLYSQWQKSIPI